MTPLAHRIAKELTLPTKDRCRADDAEVGRKLSGAHCFDVSAVVDLVQSLAEKIQDDPCSVSDVYAFLPAPRTWIEYRDAGGRGVDPYRKGWLLIAPEFPVKRVVAKLFYAQDTLAITASWPEDLPLPAAHDPANDYWTTDAASLPLGIIIPTLVAADGETQLMDMENHCFLYAALAIINTPKLIGRKQHMPHRGLERDLLRQQKVVGKFPLHAWTEITLEATPTYHDESGVEHQAHLTGRKCLHFCRAHLRVRNGKLEIVSSHWRGDPALGIRRSRYKVVLPRKSAP